MGKLIKIVGEKVVDGKRVCSACGADFENGKNTRFVANGDGLGTYSYMFECTKCGNFVTLHYKRDREERW